jgi:UDP-N-acetylmuramate dehydrogenase
MLQITPDQSFKRFNTLAIDAWVAYLADASSDDDVREVIKFAADKQLPLYVLGAGSNIILADEIPGIVLRYRKNQVQLLAEDEASFWVRVDAGVIWHEFVMHALQNAWFGLENLALIPGTCGAAPVQNIGAYGVEVESFIHEVSGIDLVTGEARIYSHDQCNFAYRDSIFKHSLRDKFLITHVVLRLNKVANPVLSYAPLAQKAVGLETVSPELLAQWVIELRRSKLPDPAESPNAGSFFKNPVLTDKQYVDLKTCFPDLPSYPSGEAYKVPAAWLIDNLGLKGQWFGPVEINRLQPLVLINHGGNGAQVLEAAREVQKRVFERFAIQLEVEPQTLP